MFPLSVRRRGIFPAFFKEQGQTFVEQFQTRQEESKPVAVVAALHFFERLKTSASAEWRAYTGHPFTDGMADGSLPETAFRRYLVQDYLFLIEFARAYALAVYKSPTLADMREAAAGISAILDVEMNLHVKLCADWGLSASASRCACALAATSR